MKKSTTHLLVITMTAVFALSACERRQRPPKKTETTQKDTGKGTPPGATVTGDQNGTDKDPAKDDTAVDPASTDPAKVDLFTKVEYNRLEDAVEAQMTALNEENLGISIGKNKDTGVFEILMDKEIVNKAIQELSQKNQAEAEAAGREDAEQEDQIADRLHEKLLTAHAAALEFTTAYGKADVVVKGMETKAEKKQIGEQVVIAMKFDEAIETLDAALHGFDFKLKTKHDFTHQE